MLQRKQSLWLMISACVLGLTFFLPFGVQMLSTVGSEQITYNALFNFTFFPILVLTLLGMLLPVATIFLFKNRPLQMRLIIIAMGLQGAALTSMILKCLDKTAGNKFVFGVLGSQLYIGLAFPLVAIVLLYLAYHGVNSDEKLVKSADRMR
ncbi:MAG: DUF4293 domain-containing protein [Chitinophagaceae bacterium]